MTIEKQAAIAKKAQREENESQQKEEMKRIKALNTNDSIYFNFSYTALKLLGKNLYSNPWTAISELVANGIDAKATEVYVFIDATDKKHSVVEILDNGFGMDYSDLANKYVWIGRNKRDDSIFSDESKMSVMGRKGIGKLAALYLSPQYSILSKKNNSADEDAWGLNVNKFRDSDLPKLERIQNKINLKTDAIFRSFNQGTAIKLSDVNLQGMGEKTLDGMKRTLADYYLLDSVETKIYFCFCDEYNKEIAFKEVEKKVAYKNFYAIFDNSSFDIYSKMANSIKLPSNIEHIAKTERPIKNITNSKKFRTSGVETFFDDEGNSFEKEFVLRGWIGIHSSIKQVDAQKNDPLFLRRDKIYNPNQLRLYVRNKLAVENFLNVIESNQAMANYIEGEICFDILDDDNLPDIATSNRQSFLEDKRVSLLKEIVSPILTKLFAERNDIGKKVTEEEEAYFEELRSQEEERAQREEEARKRAEYAREKAESDLKDAKEDLGVRAKQAYFLERALTVDERTRQYNNEVIKSNSQDIQRCLKIFLSENPGFAENIDLKSIAFAANKLAVTAQNYAMINYNYELANVEENIGSFIEEFFKGIAHMRPNMIFRVENTTSYRAVFPYQDFAMVLFNTVSNAVKANATEMTVSVEDFEKGVKIRFIDNGDGIRKGINTKTLFELGVHYTRDGSGIGLAQVKDIVENELNGQVFIYNNQEKGVTLEVVFANEN